MKIYSFLLALAIVHCLLTAGCSSKTQNQAHTVGISPALADGAYSVLAENADRGGLRPEYGSEAVVEYTRSFSPNPAATRPTFLLIRKSPFVPLRLAAPARVVDDGDGRVSVQLDFIGGAVITVHKIREPILGGGLQISCCAEGAFEFLVEQLRDNH